MENIQVLECMKNIFRYSFQGAMVGKNKNEFLTWTELQKMEQDAYKDEDSYNKIVEWAKN